MISSYGKITKLIPQNQLKSVNNVSILGVLNYIPFAGVAACKVIGYLSVCFSSL
jgi:L-cystine uptake protein TcyP (sodium:dicarboxylate symporter family)